MIYIPVNGNFRVIRKTLVKQYIYTGKWKIDWRQNPKSIYNQKYIYIIVRSQVNQKTYDFGQKILTIFQFSLNSCKFLLKKTFWIILDVFMKFRCCVFDFVNFRTLLTWIFCSPSQSGCQHRITGRIGWYGFKPSLTLQEWLLEGLVDESWRHWTGFVVCECCCQSLWWKCCEIL